MDAKAQAGPSALLSHYLHNIQDSLSEDSDDPVPTQLNTSSLNFLEVGKEKLSVKYIGEARHSNDVGAVQANCCVPKNRLIYYYEITVRDQGESGKIGVGYAEANMKPGRQPGWENNSYGYHGDDGCKFHATSRGEEFGPTFTTGDTVGAGIHLGRGDMFFTLNGRQLGVAFRGVKPALLPTVGLHSPGEHIEMNFGQAPFKFDLQAMITEDRQQSEKLISRMELLPGGCHKAVRDFLVHYGYGETAAAFESAAGSTVEDTTAANGMLSENGHGACGRLRENGDGPMSMETGDNGSANGATQCPGLSARHHVRSSLANGDVEGAAAAIKAFSPALLGPDTPYPDIPFFLNCQRFIEVIRSGQLTEAMAFAQQSLAPLRGKSEDHDYILQEIFALVAYQDPSHSPQSHLLALKHRNTVADLINTAMVAESERLGSGTSPREPCGTTLERLLQQLVVVQNAIVDSNYGQGEKFRLQRYLGLNEPATQQQSTRMEM